MNKEKLKNNIYVGVVVDNADPEKLGRCKIKVFQVFDKLADEDIPWARPWKDLNGNQFILPDVGKHVAVVFDQGNKYSPEYIYAQNFNVNLENKLKTLSGEAYTSMRAVMFDHSTQIYSNTEDGLKIDHEYSNINLDTDGNIALNLRDNRSYITLGSADGDEPAVLGKIFFKWMTKLVNALMGANGGAYLTPDGSPVTVGPQLAKVLKEFRLYKYDMLSEHVFLPANYRVIPQRREYVKQRGDGNTSTASAGTPQPSSTILDEATGEQKPYTGGPDPASGGADNVQEGKAPGSQPIAMGPLKGDYVPLDKLSGDTQNAIKGADDRTLILVREWFVKARTSGTMWYKGEVLGFTVEDAVRPTGVKVDEETAIPQGTYNIGLDTTSNDKLFKYYVRFADSPNARFRSPGVFARVGNPGNLGNLTGPLKGDISFQGIRIHGGRSETWSHSCIIYSATRLKNGTLDLDLQHNYNLTRLIYQAGISKIVVINEFAKGGKQATA